MATDARGHTVPAAGDVPARSALTNLSLSTLDPVPVTNTTTRAAAATALSPTTAKPLYTFRADAAAGAQLEVTTDGSTWSVVPARVLAAWTPAWTATSVNPTLGTTTRVGVYTVDDQYIDFRLLITVGSGFAAGSGSYAFTLPVTPAAGRLKFQGSFLHSGADYPILGHCDSSTTLNLFSNQYPIVNVSNATPLAPAVGDVYCIAGRYQKL